MRSNLFKDMLLTHPHIEVYGRSANGERFLGKGEMYDFPALKEAYVLATIVDFNRNITKVIIVDDPKYKVKR